jgi:hypothetical protein
MMRHRGIAARMRAMMDEAVHTREFAAGTRRDHEAETRAETHPQEL